MTDVIDTSSFRELFNVSAANAAESPRDTHKPAPSEDDSVPDLEPAVQPPRPVYKDTAVEPDPYLMLSYEAPAPGRSPYV
ncbi:hypothetical protein EXIGLDRAFT_776944 [Exidia glandulosa HHB12029]|uniref:Uncharacterized protein n=1 Tax=Exidia glandulosa HHB12029 TaxID=1314781 RepID=A0A165ZMB7_EXIGL|nr:hypothetical protein EXIGLDRAFT_776944 [Exidia glandulosa HHB12029]